MKLGAGTTCRIEYNAHGKFDLRAWDGVEPRLRVGSPVPPGALLPHCASTLSPFSGVSLDMMNDVNIYACGNSRWVHAMLLS